MSIVAAPLWTLRLIRKSPLQNLRLHQALLNRSPKCFAHRRLAHNPADDASFRSVIDNPPNLVSAGRRHGPGLIILGTLSNQSQLDCTSC